MPELKPDACLMRFPSAIVVLLYNASGCKDKFHWLCFDYFGVYKNPCVQGRVQFCLRPVMNGTLISIDDFPPLMLAG